MKTFRADKRAVVMLGAIVAFAAVAPVFAQATPAAAAAPPSAGLLDDILQAYINKAHSWESAAIGIAQRLFAYCAIISLAWTGIRMTLARKEFDGFIATLVKQVFLLSFFSYLVTQGPFLCGLIVSSFEHAGQVVSGSGALSPSWIATTGYDCLFRIFDAIGKMGLGDTAAFGLPMALGGLIILACFLAVAIQYLILMIEAYIVMYGGIVMLGFGALPWTREIPKNYLVYAINVGVRLFVLYLIVTVGTSLSESWPAMVTAGASKNVLHNVFLMMGGSLVFAAVAWKIPGIAGAITSGAVNMSAADGIGVATAAAGLAGGVVGAGAMAAGVLGGGAGATLRGATQATMAGAELARETSGATGLKSVVQGISHAANAAVREVGRSAGAKVGLNPISPNALDGRGRDITNMGTRAANDLAGRAADARESKAASPLSGAGSAAVGPGAAGQGNAPQPPAGSGSATGAGASVTQGGGGSGSSAPPPSGQRDPLHSASTDGGNGSLGEAIRRVAPPPMPSDGGGGGVTVNLQHHED